MVRRCLLILLFCCAPFISGAKFIGSTGGTPADATCGANDSAQCTLPATRSNADTDFTAANVKDGVNILNVTGTFAPACSNDLTTECDLNATRSTSDAQFTAGNIKDGTNILNVTGTYGPTCTGDAATACTLNTTRTTSDADFTAANVKDGVNILNVTGTYGPTCTGNAATACTLNTTRSTSDADFVAANIASGVNILNVTGTYTGSGDLTTNLTHYYKFDDTSGNATDSSGNGHTATVNGATWAPDEGHNGGAIFFDGTNDHLNVPSPSMPTGDLTVSVWIKWPYSALVRTILGIRNGSTDEFNVMVDSALMVIWMDDGAVLMSAGKAPNTAGWHMLTLTRESGVVKSYIDGGLSIQTYQPATLNYSTCDLLIGTEADAACTGTLGNYYFGWMDELRIYSTALSTDSVRLLYDAYKTPTSHAGAADVTTNLLLHWKLDDGSGTNANDETANNQDGTLTSGAAFTSSGCKVGTGCVVLDGTDDYVVTGASPGLPTGDFTYALWVNRTTANQVDAMFASMVSSASGTNELNFYFDATNDPSLIFDSGGVPSFVAHAGMPAVSAWVHMALVRRAGILTMYINGFPMKSSIDAATLNFGTCGLVVGMDPDGAGAAPCVTTPSDFFGGKIDDVRVYTSALIEASIQALAAM